MRVRHDLVARRQAQLRRAEGPQPDQSIAECSALLEALAARGLWPGPRDAASEAEVERVRKKFAAIKRAYLARKSA